MAEVKQRRPKAVTATRAPAAAAPAARFKFVNSLERGLAVISSFGEQRPQQSVADVARATGLDRSAARRFLLTLEALGYVEQQGRLFRLRAQTLQLGYAYLSSLPWWRGAQRIAERLRDQVGHNCAVGVLDGDNVLYVAYASAARFPLLDRSVGTQLPATATAIGRLLLAALPADERAERLSAKPLPRLTPATVTDPAQLARLLAGIRATDYALVDQELDIGLRSLGVPIRNRGGDLVAAMSISVIENQLAPGQIVERYLEPLRTASREITETLPR